MEEQSARWPFAAGDMAGLVRAHDWSQTQLGPLDAWPARLRHAVELVLETVHPATVVWGADLCQVYNDSLVPIVGDRHPAALGRPMIEVWPELAEPLGRLRTRLVESGRDIGIADRDLATLMREGHPFRRWLDWSWTPIRNDVGSILGFVGNGIRTKPLVGSEAWLEAQKNAFQSSMNGEGLERSLGILARVAVQHADGAPRCAFYISNKAGGLRHVVGMSKQYAAQVDGLQNSPESLACEQTGTTGGPVITPDVHEDPRWRPWTWLAQAHGYRACWSFPVETDSGNCIGSFAMYFAEPRSPMQRDFDLVTALTQAAALLISRHDEAEQRARAQADLRESEERFRQFAEASSDVVWVRDAEKLHWEYLSPAFETVYGLDRDAALRGDHVQSWSSLVLEEDRDEALANLERVLAGERVTHCYRIRRPVDGAIRWLRDTNFPLLDGDGRVQRVGGIGHDETEERDTAERMQVMVHELQHRTRNLIGVVRSFARETVATTRSSDEFQSRFGERLESLSRVQGLLSRSQVEPITIGALIGMELVALGSDHARDRIHVAGPEVRLHNSTVQTLALVIHELATNARKYGAVSTEKGQLTIEWSAENELLDLRWTETGVQSEAANSAPVGYGRRLIEQALPYSVGARTEYDLTQKGLRCRILLPLGTNVGRQFP